MKEGRIFEWMKNRGGRKARNQEVEMKRREVVMAGMKESNEEKGRQD